MHPTEVCQLAIAALTPLLGGVLAASSSGPNSDLRGGWFEHKLKKPSFFPPQWLFAPVWMLLYVSVGLASWLVWRQGGIHQQGKALGMYAATLALTFVWPILFFRLYRLDWAFAELILLIVAEVSTFLAFCKLLKRYVSTCREKVIGLLLCLMLLGPLLAWTGFSLVLNLVLLHMNRGEHGKFSNKGNLPSS